MPAPSRGDHGMLHVCPCIWYRECPLATYSDMIRGRLERPPCEIGCWAGGSILAGHVAIATRFPRRFCSPAAVPVGSHFCSQLHARGTLDCIVRGLRSRRLNRRTSSGSARAKSVFGPVQARISRSPAVSAHCHGLEVQVSVLD